MSDRGEAWQYRTSSSAVDSGSATSSSMVASPSASRQTSISG